MEDLGRISRECNRPSCRKGSINLDPLKWEGQRQVREVDITLFQSNLDWPGWQGSCQVRNKIHMGQNNTPLSPGGSTSVWNGCHSAGEWRWWGGRRSFPKGFHFFEVDQLVIGWGFDSAQQQLNGDDDVKKEMKEGRRRQALVDHDDVLECGTTRGQILQALCLLPGADQHDHSSISHNLLQLFYLNFFLNSHTHQGICDTWLPKKEKRKGSVLNHREKRIKRTLQDQQSSTPLGFSARFPHELPVRASHPVPQVLRQTLIPSSRSPHRSTYKHPRIPHCVKHFFLSHCTTKTPHLPNECSTRGLGACEAKKEKRKKKKKRKRFRYFSQESKVGSARYQGRDHVETR